MTEEFESIHQDIQVLEIPANPVESTRRHRAGVALAGIGLTIGATFGIGLLSEAPAEASTSAESYDPSASFAQKAQNVDAIAHRGLKGYYKGRWADEDTVRACLHAVAAGANACEIDIRTPKHGKYTPKPLVIHDNNTDRVSRDCNLKVSTHTFRRLKKCHTNHGDRFSSLSELAVAMSPYRNRVSIIAEIKDDDATKRELRTINNIFRKNGFNGSNLTYESFYGKKLRAMKSIAPDVDALLIKGNINSPLRATSLPSAFDGLIIPYKAFVNGVRANPHYAEEYRARNEDIIPWGVETVDQMAYVTAHGASGFMSNHVGRARRLR